jgi:hypothetical protein
MEGQNRRQAQQRRPQAEGRHQKKILHSLGAPGNRVAGILSGSRGHVCFPQFLLWGFNKPQILKALPPHRSDLAGCGHRALTTRNCQVMLHVPDAVQRICAAPQSRDPYFSFIVQPWTPDQQRSTGHSASKTRVNALMVLRCIRGTKSRTVEWLMP